MQIIECAQGSEEWLIARLAVPTASNFSVVMAGGRGGAESKTRAKYMRQLAAEAISGRPVATYSNHHMDRGREQEAEARTLYAFMHDVEPQQVGFIRNGRAGCSPDALIGTDGGLEIKSALGDIQIERIEADRLPPEYRAQVQGGLWITERSYWDFVSYSPGLPLLVKRVHRDEIFIAELSRAIDRFNEELDELIERIRRYGGVPAMEAA